MVKERVVQISRWFAGHAKYELLGSGVVIASDLVITAKHVIARVANQWPPTDLFSANEVFLHSDQGAFGGGWPSVVDVIAHPDLDVALLRARGSENEPAPLPQEPVTVLPHGKKMRLHGYSAPTDSVADLDVRLVATASAFGLDYLDKPSEHGYSGGAVCLNETLVGIVCRSTNGQTLVQPLDRRVFELIHDQVTMEALYRSMPISPHHLRELRDILAQLDPPPSELVDDLFARIIKRSPSLKPKPQQTQFDAALEDLQTRRQWRDESPFLLFLQACRIEEAFDRSMDEDTRKRLDVWLDAAIARVGIEPLRLQAQVDAVLNPPTGHPPPTLLCKIEPLLDRVEEVYCLRTWWGYAEPEEPDARMPPRMEFDQVGNQADQSDAEVPEEAVDRDHLANALAIRLQRALNLRRPDWRHDLPRLEIVSPLTLLDWSPRQVQIRSSNCITHDYPVILRSWERHCDWSSPGTLSDLETPGAWARKSDALRRRVCLNQQHVMSAAEVRALADRMKQTLCGQYWAMIAHCPRANDREEVQQRLLDGLCEGLPLMLWPLVDALDTEAFHNDLLHWLCGTPHADLPELLHRTRRDSHPDWQDLAVLWDDARRRIPGTNFPAHSTK
jgi:hypothetical protein